jgi:peptide/nickel transport system ATP-binding protein
MSAGARANSADGVVVQGLTVVIKRRKVPVVEDVGFEIPPGKVLGLVGESGSGKSTVGVALLGRARRGLEIASGKVMVAGRDILALSPRELRDARGRLVSYVPQDPASGLNPVLRVGTQLREAVLVHRASDRDVDVDERVRTLLREVALPDTDELLGKFPHQLSGGQQQRIGIAMAFAWRPKLVVLDEPTTGLDVTTQRRVLETVRALAESNEVSALYVSHDLPVVAQVAHETAVMYAGRIVERAGTAELFRAPRHHYTVGLLKAAPSPDQTLRLVGIEGRPPRPGSWPVGCAFADRCARATEQCRTEAPTWVAVGSHGFRCWEPLAAAASPVVAESAAMASPTGGSADLVVRGLSAHYGQKLVLSAVDVSLPSGSCTAVVGESGSGKTTLARCIVGLHSDCAGEMTLGNEPLSAGFRTRTDGQRRRMQYVFQNPYASLNPRMSIGENLEEPLRHFESLGATERRRKVLDILETVALTAAFANRMPDQLSGGERQRAAVGRALIVDPDVMVCDEVTSALDVSVQALLVEQLRELQRSRGLSLLFITHNLAVVRSIAQVVVVVEQGCVVEAGPVEQVLDHPQHPYTKALLADLPRLRQEPEATKTPA